CILLHRRVLAGGARGRRARGRLDRQLDRRACTGAGQSRRESVAAGRPRALDRGGRVRGPSARAYKDINLLALKLLAPGGLLATFSCSGGVSADLFQKIVAGAAVDAKVDATIVGHFAASADHPVALAFPEGEYLKGLLIRRN